MSCLPTALALDPADAPAAPRCTGGVTPSLTLTLMLSILVSALTDWSKQCGPLMSVHLVDEVSIGIRKSGAHEHERLVGNLINAKTMF